MFYLEKIDVKEIESCVGNGVTLPMFCILEDNTYAVFKSINNPQGKLALCNELIGYRIALELEMPIPIAGLGIINNETEIPDSVLEKYGETKESFIGIGFYSRKISKSTIIHDSNGLDELSNINDIPKIIMFDFLLGNYDRNPGNSLIDLSKGNYRFFIIDHTHIFDIGTIWNDIQLRRLKEDFDINRLLTNTNGIYEFYCNTYEKTKKEMENIANFISEKLTEEKIKDIVNEVPDEWGLSSQDRNGAIEYIYYRKSKLIDYVDDIMKGRV